MELDINLDDMKEAAWEVRLLSPHAHGADERDACTLAELCLCHGVGLWHGFRVCAVLSERSSAPNNSVKQLCETTLSTALPVSVLPPDI